MSFNEIKCHVNISLGLVGGCIPCIPPVSAPGLKTPRRFCKIDQMNYENSPQPIWLCTQYSLRCQN